MLVAFVLSTSCACAEDRKMQLTRMATGENLKEGILRTGLNLVTNAPLERMPAPASGGSTFLNGMAAQSASPYGEGLRVYVSQH